MENYNEKRQSLLESIREKIGKPVSVHVVEATIESFGIRENDSHLQ